MENQVHQSLSQLERIRQMTIVPKASAKQPAPQKPEPAPKPNPAPQKPEPKPEPVLEPETPEKIDPSEITRQIELNLSKILGGGWDRQNTRRGCVRRYHGDEASWLIHRQRKSCHRAEKGI